MGNTNNLEENVKECIKFINKFEEPGISLDETLGEHTLCGIRFEIKRTESLITDNEFYIIFENMKEQDYVIEFNNGNELLGILIKKLMADKIISWFY